MKSTEKPTSGTKFEQNARSKKNLVQITAILEGDECKFEMAIADL